MEAPAKIGRGKFSGDLSAFSIFEVCQFLMIVRHTGTVTIRCAGRSGTITISEGQIASVVDDSLKEGEDAFYNIVTWKNGTFEFAPGPVATSPVWYGHAISKRSTLSFVIWVRGE